MAQKNNESPDNPGTITEKGETIAHEPEPVLDARKGLKRKNTDTFITIGVAFLVAFIWFLSVWIESVYCGILGIIFLCLSIFFISFGFYKRTQVNKMRPITTYENGIEMPQTDGQMIFFSFNKFSKYPRETSGGYETIILQKGHSEYTLVLWPELLELINKKPKKTRKAKTKKREK